MTTLLLWIFVAILLVVLGVSMVRMRLPRATRVTLVGVVVVLLIVTLKRTSEWPRGQTAADESVRLSGEQLFTSAGCAACHSIGRGVVIGPDLEGVGERYPKEVLVQWIVDPSILYEQRGIPLNQGFPMMPKLGVSEADAVKIVEYLLAPGGRSWLRRW